MRSFFWAAAVCVLAAAFFSSRAEGADAAALVKQLGSANAVERAAAIVELQKMGEAGCDALAKIERNETLEPQQLLLVRKIQGDRLIAQTPLAALGLKGLTPFCEDKEKGIAGNPNLLVDKDRKLIVMNGEFVLEQGPLEYLVVSKGPNARLHETVVGVFVQPRDICYAFLACAYTYAGELGADGKVNLPKGAGVMISIEFLWEPVTAATDVLLDPASLILGLQHKNALLEKAGEAERENLLFGMANDHGFLRRLLDHDETDDAGKLIAKTPFADDTRDDQCVYDAGKRKALLNTLQGYLKGHPAKGAADAPAALPEKKLVRVPIEYFAWNSGTGGPMKRAPFAFTGSKFEKNPDTNKLMFMADIEKSVVACKLDSYAILNTVLDMRGVDPQHAAGYGLNWRAVPRRGTKCRIVFEPWTGSDLKDDEVKDIGDKGAKPAPPPAPQQ